MQVGPSHPFPSVWLLRRGRDTATHFEIAQSSQRQLRVKNRSTPNPLIAKTHIASEVQSVENEQEKCPVDKSLWCLCLKDSSTSGSLSSTCESTNYVSAASP